MTHHLKEEAKDTTELREIGQELKTLGRKLIDAGDHMAETTGGKQAVTDIKAGLSQAGEDLKSGKLAEDVKKEILTAFKFFNEKLDQFTK